MIGRVIGHYRIDGPTIGGAPPMTFPAVDLRSDRRVLLQFLPDQTTEMLPHLDQRVERFQQQSTIHHRNVATVLESHRDDGGCWITYDRREGRTLAEAVARGPFSPEDAAAMALQIVGGLAVLHEHGIVGTELDPEEILLGSDGVVVLLYPPLPRHGRDEVGDGLHRLDRLVYLAPERIAGERLHPSADIFSVGVLLHHLITGSYPFHGETVADLLTSIAGKKPELNQSLSQNLPEELRQVIEKALRKDTHERYGSMREIQRDLERVTKNFRKRRTLRLLSPFTLLVLFLIATLIAAAVILWSRSQPHRRPTVRGVVSMGWDRQGSCAG